MQKKWRKKQKQAERAQQSQSKAESLAKLRDPNSRRGFRKIHIDGQVYPWRYYGDKVEIRTPDGDRKYLVPIWAFQDYESETAWLKDHCECYEECSANWIQPGMVRKYIETNIIPTEKMVRS